MKLFLCLLTIGLASCKRGPQPKKEYITPEEKKVLDEMSKSYKKN